MHDLAMRGRHEILCADETPLNPCLTFSNIEEVERAFGLGPTRNRETRACVLANLIYARLAGFADVHYSRDRNHYSKHAQSIGLRHWTYTKVLAAVDDLRESGLALEDRTRPGPHREVRSRIRLQGPMRPNDFTLVEVSLKRVVLKNGDGDPVAYKKTPTIRRLRKDVAEHNEFLAGIKVTLDHPDVQRRYGLLYQTGKPPILERTKYYRVFNETWKEGGRWYGPWWQNCRKDLRACIKLDGQDTVEEDYRTFHPRLVCALAGLDLPFDDKVSFDFYRIGDFIRAHVKPAVNIMINARSVRGAVLALAKKLREEHDVTVPYRLAREIVLSVMAAHPALDRYWNTAIGRRLQRLDGDLCARIQRRLRRSGIPCLSIHDSFIVPVQHRDHLAELMSNELDRTIEEAKRIGAVKLL